jgi:hypothetical protein
LRFSSAISFTHSRGSLNWVNIIAQSLAHDELAIRKFKLSIERAIDRWLSERAVDRWLSERAVDRWLSERAVDRWLSERASDSFYRSISIRTKYIHFNKFYRLGLGLIQIRGFSRKLGFFNEASFELRFSQDGLIQIRVFSTRPHYN